MPAEESTPPPVSVRHTSDPVEPVRPYTYESSDPTYTIPFADTEGEEPTVDPVVKLQARVPFAGVIAYTLWSSEPT